MWCWDRSGSIVCLLPYTKQGMAKKKIVSNHAQPRPLPTRFANAWQNFVQKNIIYFIKTGDPQSIWFSSFYCCCCCERRLLLLLTWKHLIAFITILRFVCACACACSSDDAVSERATVWWSRFVRGVWFDLVVHGSHRCSCNWIIM